MLTKRKIFFVIFLIIPILFFVFININEKGQETDFFEEKIPVIDTVSGDTDKYIELSVLNDVIEMQKSEIKDIDYSVEPKNADISYSVKNNIVSVDNEGRINPQESGETVIIVRAEKKGYKSVEKEIPLIVKNPEYTLSIDLTGQGKVVPEAGKYTYPQGTVVELVAESESEWEFSKWQGQVTQTDNKNIEIIIDDNKQIKAIFEEKVPEYPVLRRGDSGEKVGKLQQKLWDLGYRVSTDGIFGAETEEVISAFQKSFDLKVDGVAGDQTWQLINRMDNTTIYEVQAGDTLIHISNKFDVDVDYIKVINDIKGDYIVIGQELEIPRSNVGGDESSDPVNTVKYEVQRGDSLSEIANNYNTDIESIKSKNNINSSNIRAGQTLKIYAPEEESSINLEKGSLPWPVEGPITSGYGWRDHPITGRRQFHGGIDIAASRGTPVQAVADGVVVETDWRGGFGKTVIIDHGQGINTFYAHNSRILIRKGAQVRKGQVISLVGSTGQSTGPHVDFRIFIDDERVNPLHYLK